MQHKGYIPADIKNPPGFTLIETLIAISIFAIVVTIATDMEIQSFRQSAFANSRNQTYEDAWAVLTKIEDEIKNGMIDYDEYYNQKVVQPELAKSNAEIAHINDDRHKNYGQNFGRYYSSFFHPGDDDKLGFLCNDDLTRNKFLTNDGKKCTPKRRTIDRNTGQNPFQGKYDESGFPGPGVSENAFCGTVSYQTDGNGPQPNPPCPQSADQYVQDELYLISADGKRKTILAREKTYNDDTYALSMLRLDGQDTDGDGMVDAFVCGSDFTCVGEDEVPEVPRDPARENFFCYGDADHKVSGRLPRSRAEELETGEVACDTADKDFAYDFVPVMPLKGNVKELKFIISPLENPHYAFAENDITQPRVTIILTVSPFSAGASQQDKDVTLVETVPVETLAAIESPVNVE